MGFEFLKRAKSYTNKRIQELVDERAIGRARRIDSFSIDFDGDMTGRATFKDPDLGDNITFVKVSDKMIHPSAGLTFFVRNLDRASGNHSEYIIRDTITEGNYDEGGVVAPTGDCIFPLLALCTNEAIPELGIEAGMYVPLYDHNEGAASETDHITFVYHVLVGSVEEVTTIDPKYLPGASVPFVELSQETMLAVLSEGTATATREEHLKFREAAENTMPIVVKGRIDNGDGAYQGLCAYASGHGTEEFMYYDIMFNGQTVRAHVYAEHTNDYTQLTVIK